MEVVACFESNLPSYEVICTSHHNAVSISIPALVHRTAVNALKGNTDFKPSVLCSSWNWNTRVTEELNSFANLWQIFQALELQIIYRASIALASLGLVCEVPRTHSDTHHSVGIH